MPKGIARSGGGAELVVEARSARRTALIELSERARRAALRGRRAMHPEWKVMSNPFSRCALRRRRRGGPCVGPTKVSLLSARSALDCKRSLRPPDVGSRPEVSMASGSGSSPRTTWYSESRAHHPAGGDRSRKIIARGEVAEDLGACDCRERFLHPVTGAHPLERCDALSRLRSISFQGRSEDCPTRSVVCRADRAGDPDCLFQTAGGSIWTPRHVLRKVLELYASGVEPVCARADSTCSSRTRTLIPAQAPWGASRSGRPGRTAGQHRRGVNEFSIAFDDILPVLRGQGDRDRHADPRG